MLQMQLDTKWYDRIWTKNRFIILNEYSGVTGIVLTDLFVLHYLQSWILIPWEILLLSKHFLSVIFECKAFFIFFKTLRIITTKKSVYQHSLLEETIDSENAEEVSLLNETQMEEDSIVIRLVFVRICICALLKRRLLN